MASDLVERLRDQVPQGTPLSVCHMLDEAADRITELEAEVERLKNLAKQNNNLAKMYKQQADEFRAKYVSAAGGPD